MISLEVPRRLARGSPARADAQPRDEVRPSVVLYTTTTCCLMALDLLMCVCMRVGVYYLFLLFFHFQHS